MISIRHPNKTKPGPARVSSKADLPVTILGGAAALTMLAAIYAIFEYAPEELVQGEPQRIFYVHVPLAWVAYLSFFLVFIASIAYLWKRDARWDHLAQASAELGLAFTTLVLITGSFWGRPIWGTWWTWDARLTTTLVLWFIYLGYLMLRSYSGAGGQGARLAAVLGIIGFVDVPIIHLSVTWWRTLHPQAVVLQSSGPALPPEMLITLMISLVAFTLLYAYLLVQRVHLARLHDEVYNLQHQLSQREEEHIHA